MAPNTYELDRYVRGSVSAPRRAYGGITNPRGSWRVGPRVVGRQGAAARREESPR